MGCQEGPTTPGVVSEKAEKSARVSISAIPEENPVAMVLGDTAVMDTASERLLESRNKALLSHWATRSQRKPSGS